MTAVSRSQLNREMQNLSPIASEAEFFQQLLPEQTDMARCNIVILGDCIIFARIPQSYKIPYYLLCKHITLADHSTDVRFAGELWHDENANFQLNNNSGTYRPSKILVESAIALFKHLFPFLEVRGLSWEESARPPTFDRFKFKLKQRITCELWHDENANFQLNNNSGTYRPSKILVESAIALFKHLFPFLEVRGLSWEESARPPTFDRFKFKLKQRITCS
ncbi:unnamed protein product [Rotaria socialis]|uniref:Uncharacterized protein n=1 Tax=Rotaria socialis TaxID=392032 RepID=A0A818KDS3_9BILA|nr:unnamed protein product [Rotaria socialis]